MRDEIRVLLVEDSPDDAVFVIAELEKGGLKVQQRRVDTARDMRDTITRETWDVILCDYSIPGFGALPALALLKEMKCDVPAIIISGVIGEESAVEAMRSGAHDFIVKGKYARLVPAVRREIEEYIQLKAREAEAKKQKAEAVKQRQLAFTMIMQNPQPLLIIDTKFDIKLANEAFLTMSGFSEEKLQKMNIREFKILKKSGHNLKEAVSTKKGVTGEVTVEFPKATHNLEQVTIPLLDKEGEIVSIMAVYNDLTDKLIEEAKREELANYITAYLSSMADNLTKLAKGDLDFNLEIAPSSKATQEARQWFTDINKNLADVKGALDLLISDANTLSKAAVEGKLDTRADAMKHQGDYRKIIEGVNGTLDAVIGPLNVAAEYVDRISKGDIPAKIADKYNGDFNEIKNSLNACIDGLQGLVEANNVLERMAVNDHSKGVEGIYQGVFAETKTSVNLVQDRVNRIVDIVDRISNGDLSDGAELRKIGKRSDLDRLIPAFIRTFDALEALTNDANLLTKAAVEGKLKTRTDATKHQGDYKKIVEGMNATLDAMAEPVHEAMRTANEFAKCNFSARVDEKLHMEGDFIKFKDALNSIGTEVSKAMTHINQQIMELASSAEEANASIEEVSSGAEQIAKNAAGVSTNAAKGSDGIGQVLRAMEDLNQTVTEVAQKSEKVSQLTENANHLSVKGTDLAEQAERGMQSITTSSAEVEKIIVDIKAEMDKIGKIVGLIRDLANQTNLLALNAAIEAARAGEAGRGFAVVATEVKSLAQESRASAENIADMIGTLQKKSVAAGEAVASSNREVKTGSEALAQTLRSFKDIAKSIEDISRNIVEVASATEEQAATVEEVTASINEVQQMVQMTSKDAIDAAAASEEASASIDQITKVVGNVNTIVDSVSREIAKFKV